MGDRLQHLSAHDAILLLKHSFAIPKLLYCLRTAPCFRSPRLQKYDDLLKKIVSGITNVHFSEGDPAWTQATLPVKWEDLVSGVPCTLRLVPTWLQLLPPMSLFVTLCHLVSKRLHFPVEVKQKTYGLKAMINHLLREWLSGTRISGTISRHPPLLTPSWTMHMILEPLHIYLHLLLRNLEHG